jgi:hypothetical protein
MSKRETDVEAWERIKREAEASGADPYALFLAYLRTKQEKY